MNVNKETIIEGIGDEVLLVVAILIIIVVVFLIWLSKEFNYSPFYLRQYFQSTNEDTQSNIRTEISEELESDKITVGQNEFEENKITPINEPLAASGDTNQSNNSNKESETVPPGFIVVKLKYLDDRTRTVYTDPQTTILDFKRDNFQDDLNNNKNVRLIYNGKELKELDGESTLAGYGVVDNATIHCLITQRQENITTSQSAVTDASSISDLNMGSLMFPLFGVLLSLVWYYRLNYKHHFNIASTFVLVSLTGIYFVACFVNYSTSPSNTMINNRNNINTISMASTSSVSISSNNTQQM